MHNYVQIGMNPALCKVHTANHLFNLTFHLILRTAYSSGKPSDVRPTDTLADISPHTIVTMSQRLPKVLTLIQSELSFMFSPPCTSLLSSFSCLVLPGSLLVQ
jgi:hypothetical protein